MTQDDKEGLEKLLTQLDKFQSGIFDWVGFLGRVDFLHQVYDFRFTVEEKLKEVVPEVVELDAF